jgi:hypothetical protein
MYGMATFFLDIGRTINLKYNPLAGLRLWS